jgi:hypothetical protein
VRCICCKDKELEAVKGVLKIIVGVDFGEGRGGIEKESDVSPASLKDIHFDLEYIRSTTTKWLWSGVCDKP